MTDRQALITAYVQRQKDHADIQERFKNCKCPPIFIDYLIYSEAAS